MCGWKMDNLKLFKSKILFKRVFLGVHYIYLNMFASV
jgi:hypothetical protein